MCSNALPTKENLKRRKVLDDAKCSACLSAQESTFHAIWSCELLHQIWNPCFGWVRTEHPRIQEVQELVYLVGLWKESLELFAVVVWFIWNHRNWLRLNEKGIETDRIFSTAKEYLSEFQLKLPKPVPKPSKASIRWRPLVGELYKTNFNRAVFRELSEVGIGVVVRDAKGEVIVALAKKITFSGIVEMLEALALEGL